jgi:hypothetical protein
MAGNYDWDEEMDRWCGEGPDDPKVNDPLLGHLSDIDIIGLGDSYDDARIDLLASAYVKLRSIRVTEAINADLHEVARLRRSREQAREGLTTPFREALADIDEQIERLKEEGP